MEVETILNLFDFYWFDLDLFSRKPSKNTKKIPEIPPSNSEIIPASLPTIHTRKNPVEKTPSSSKHNNNNYSPANKIDSSFSPNSVLLTPKLQTIFSGKISEDIEDDSKSLEKQKSPQNITTTVKNNTTTTTSPLKGSSVITHNNRRRKKKGLSKSLSDLEFEELKGFMDLGFVFSEDDIKDSSLASIIPGLQRLGNNNNNNGNNTNHNHNVISNNIINDNVDEISNKKVEKMVEKSGGISRPYLSEAWEVMERKRKENELLKSRVPDPNSQIQMKDYLRNWAHTVASTVRS